MDRFGDQLLAGAALTEDQHGRVGGADAVDQPQDLFERTARSDDASAARGSGQLLAQLLELGQHLLLLERPAHDDLHLVESERLREVVVGAAPYGVERRVTRAVRGHDDDGRAAIHLLDLVDRVEAAHAGQAHVHQDQVELRRLERLERQLGGWRHRDGVLLALQRFLQEELHLWIVVHHENLKHVHLRCWSVLHHDDTPRRRGTGARSGQWAVDVPPNEGVEARGGLVEEWEPKRLVRCWTLITFLYGYRPVLLPA